MQADLVIHGGTVVNEWASLRASLAIKDGRILAIGDASAMPDAAETVDATGRHLLPGLIDVHVHVREPGLTHKEDWGTATRAAAAGGVTTIFDMPNTDPPTGTRAALALKQSLAAQKAVVDYGIYGLLDESNLDILEDLVADGVIGFKLFIGNTTGNLPCPSDGAILEGFETLARLGLRCTVHAENSPILFRREQAMMAAGRDDVFAHLAARPDICAIEALNRTAVFAEWTGARVHIAHESTRHSLPHIRAAKARGVDITVETCPQYLFLTTDDMLGPDASVLRVNPPIREPGHAAPLFAALLDGTIDMLATDHAPHLPAEKRRARIWDCGCGFPGVETAMPLMLTEVASGRLAIEQYVRATSGAPARAFGLYPRKGLLAPGADADIAIVDLEKPGQVSGSRLHSRSRITPFEGRATRGAPVMTLVRGRTVMRDGVVMGEAGWGRPVRPQMPPAAPRNLDRTTAAIIAPENWHAPAGDGRSMMLDNPVAARLAFRGGYAPASTVGVAPGRVQANLVVLPQDWSAAFLAWCRANPQPCPVLGISAPGSFRIPALGDDLDLRTDLPRYQLWRDGVVVDEPTDLVSVWAPDWTAVALGCSYSFDDALAAAGVPLRHVTLGVNPPIYESSLQTVSGSA